MNPYPKIALSPPYVAAAGSSLLDATVLTLFETTPVLVTRFAIADTPKQKIAEPAPYTVSVVIELLAALAALVPTEFVAVTVNV